jgi:Short C-terminal domain
MFFFGLLFVALSAMFIRGAATDDSFTAVGIGVGALFAVMGLGPMVMAIRGWFGADGAEATSRASGIAAFTQLAQQGMMGPPTAPAVFAGPVTAPPRPADSLDRLQQLGDLHARGVLTDAEFAAQKARILNDG